MGRDTNDSAKRVLESLLESDAEGGLESGVFRRGASAVHCLCSAGSVILADAWNALSVRGVGRQGARRTRPLHALSTRRFRGTHPSPAAFQIRFSSTPFVQSPADFRSP